MKKKILFTILSISLILSSCGGSDENKDSGEIAEGFRLYSAEEFQIQVPSDWETLESSTFTSDIPKNTLVAFRNNIRSSLFTENIAIVKDELPIETETLDYSKALYEKVKHELTSTRAILTEEIQIKVNGKETKTLITEIEGKPQPSADTKRFIHLAAVKGKTVYLVIGALLPSENEGVVKKMETAVRSFEVK